ncbi:MAG TPA: DUF6364 family protein [Candidatus Limnocylindria bacterium]|nr:DUF6364 family protein [Candidatus Limnocylindria bacterium]
MKTKLTLSVDQDLVQFARQQARAHKKSVSGMFSEFLTHRRAQVDKVAVPSIASMAGSLKHYAVDDSKEAIRAAYAKKYSR